MQQPAFRWPLVCEDCPTSSATPDINGNVMGSIAGLAPISLTVNVPILGEETLSLDVAGSWAASAGEDGFGGDMNITVPIDDLKHLTEMPFEFSGNFSVDPDIPGVSPIPVAFEAVGAFPFSLDLN